MQEDTSYNVGLVELVQPKKGAGEQAQLLRNDDVLTKAAKEVKQVLYVYVKADADEPKSNVCSYISSIYSRLWDEMITNDNLNLECIVLGDVYGSGFLSRSQAQGLPGLDALYTFDASVTEAVNKDRRGAGLNPIVGVSNAAAMSEYAAGGKIYYFDADGENTPKFKRVALGGTFDRLHNGHKKLLTLAAGSTTDALVVGITGDVMLAKKKNAAAIFPFAERAAGVKRFLDCVKPALKFEPVELVDPFGPTISDKNIEAIVVSSETLPGAVKINELRADKGMKPLSVLVSRRGESATLSSTFIRQKNGGKRAVFGSFLRNLFSSGGNKGITSPPPVTLPEYEAGK